VDDREARARAARVDGLLGELEEVADPVARERAVEVVRALVELYGEALARVVERAGTELQGELVSDELLSHLLIVHDLHPLPVERRVAGALEEVRPYLESHGGGVELLGVEDGVARLRLRGSCEGCPSSAMTLKLAVEEAIERAAPDVERIDAEGAEPAEAPSPALLQLEVADGLRPAGGWEELAGVPALGPGETALVDAAGDPLLLLRVARRLYAYRPRCPGCAASLEDATLHGAELRCPGCGKAYDVRRAGRCLDAPRLHLEPVPLLEGDGVRVALGAVAA
jgi:Fe-S cluster biogenesis protein NfuA/nitrite reductase/ring-hydroxylating ferredoxin subunit